MQEVSLTLLGTANTMAVAAMEEVSCCASLAWPGLLSAASFLSFKCKKQDKICTFNRGISDPVSECKSNFLLSLGARAICHKHAFAYIHSPAVQSKIQTSGYIDTYLIISFVAIGTQAASSLSHYVRENHSSDLESSLWDLKKIGMAHNCNPFPGVPLNMPVILYRCHAQDKNNWYLDWIKVKVYKSR